MKAKPEGTTQRRSRGRIAAALCTAGVAAVALSGHLTGAAAGDGAIPGEQVTAPPMQPTGDDAAAPAPSPATTTQTTTTPAAAGSGTTTTPPAQTTAAPPAGQTPAAPTPAALDAAPAPAAAPSAPPTASREPVEPLPLTGLAGPAEGEQPGAKRCSPKKRRPAAAKAKPAVEGAGSAAVERAGSAAVAGAGSAAVARSRAATAVKRCAAKPRSRRTLSPERAPRRDRAPKVALRNAEGVPTIANPTTSLALPGAVPVGVPNFFIDKFRIPPFLLPIYQAAGIQYGIRWEILAAINEIETDYGRNLNISSAGALGWMQFMPATWKAYGTDANRDGRKDPFNPVDAIFAAARYLRAAGAEQDLRRAIFAYNHADWYVESVLMRARLIGGMPADLVGSLNGLTQGHFPVFGRARYADDLSERAIMRRVADGRNVANPIESNATRRGIDIFAKPGSPAIAVQDGTIAAIGRSKRLGNYVRLRDVYGNSYTYAHLKKVARHVPVPKRSTQSRASIARELALPKRDPRPTRAASAGRQTTARAETAAAEKRAAAALASRAQSVVSTATAASALAKARLFANPARRNAYANGGAQQILEAGSALAAGATLKSYFTGVYGLDPEDVELRRLLVGRRVIAGTILGRVGRTDEKISPRL
ncbi:MAG TPA: lytic murein transglycosylase, partial [Solirubrobacteraceae bacterium]|nr:lytic murein transglycosylase [Solirubrobacteraceae bacterium]